MKVEALQMGYYKHKRRKEGERFFLNSEADFSVKWMKNLEVKEDAPAKSSKARSKPVKKAPSKDEEVI